MDSEGFSLAAQMLYLQATVIWLFSADYLYCKG